MQPAPVRTAHSGLVPRAALAAAALATLAVAAPAAAQDTTAALRPPAARADSMAVPARPLTLIDAITLGRRRGVTVALARLGAETADRRVGERRSELLPQVSGAAGYTRQTINFEEFGF